MVATSPLSLYSVSKVTRLLLNASIEAYIKSGNKITQGLCSLSALTGCWLEELLRGSVHGALPHGEGGHVVGGRARRRGDRVGGRGRGSRVRRGRGRRH